MKEKIKNIVKYNRIIYKIYYMIASSLIKFLGIFIQTDERLILMNSFGGKKYDDSPRVIYEYLISNKEYDKYKIVWALDDININIPGRAEKVKNDTISYYIVALKAKYWITNSSLERGLKFKKKNTISLNTWHGSTIKSLDSKNQAFRGHFDGNIFLAINDREKKYFSDHFDIPIKNMFICGLPRNDELMSVNEQKKKEIKDKFVIKNKLNPSKKIILYAPTFREYININHKNTLKNPIDFNYWKKELGDKYILLFRAHYETSQIMNFNPDNEFTFDMSRYENLNELMIVSDILISDYSSIINDWALLEKPIIDYAYDLEEYKNKRGLVDYVWNEIPNVLEDEKEVLELLKNIDYEMESNNTKKFCDKIGNKIENSTKKAVEALFNYKKGIKNEY